jgi:hypothetical protein
MNKLDPETARLQVERVGAEPRFDHMPQDSVANDDALDFVATMSEILSRDATPEVLAAENDSEGDELARRGGTGVGRALASLLPPQSNSRGQLRAHALRLRRCLTEGKRAPDEENELLIRAWNTLKRTLTGGDFPRRWTPLTPKWDPSWLKESRKKPKQFIRLLGD